MPLGGWTQVPGLGPSFAVAAAVSYDMNTLGGQSSALALFGAAFAAAESSFAGPNPASGSGSGTHVASASAVAAVVAVVPAAGALAGAGAAPAPSSAEVNGLLAAAVAAGDTGTLWQVKWADAAAAASKLASADAALESNPPTVETNLLTLVSALNYLEPLARGWTPGTVLPKRVTVNNDIRKVASAAGTRAVSNALRWIKINRPSAASAFAVYDAFFALADREADEIDL